MNHTPARSLIRPWLKMASESKPYRVRCACDLLVWEDVLGRGIPIMFKPFAAIADGAKGRCHLCSLLFGSLKAYEPPQGYTRLTDDCPCASGGRHAFVQVYNGENSISVTVLCDKVEKIRHMAILCLSTLPHNRQSCNNPELFVSAEPIAYRQRQSCSITK